MSIIDYSIKNRVVTIYLTVILIVGGNTFLCKIREVRGS